MNNLFKSLLLAAVIATPLLAEAKDYVATSPDGHLHVIINDDAALCWSISLDPLANSVPSKTNLAQVIMLPSPIGITTDAGVWGEARCIRNSSVRTISRTINTVAYKRSEIHEECNEMTLRCKGDFDLVVRVYNDGCAYRLVSKSNKSLRIVDEKANFAFENDYKAFVPYVNDNRGGERYCYSFESYYDEQPLSALYTDSLAITPLAVCMPQGTKAVVMETAVDNYPGMFVKKDESRPNAFTAEFAPLPLETVVGGFDRLNLVPVRRADYIAELQPKQALPWRLVLVTTDDTQLLNTDTPFCLAPECRVEDTSWIRPGKVAWDWWNNWNLSGVDFRAGINTPTYKYYIDFAHDNGLEYIIVDEGWSSEEDLLTYSGGDLSIPELVAYGRERNVGVILWSSWRNLIKNMDRNMSHYAAAGVKGFKVDFFDRDDQEAIRSSYEIAAAAARHHLLVDFHGLKPSGVQRAYPNVVNFEGVKGLENCKWEPRNANGPVHDMPRYDVSIPYLRMLPGPLDYTPGAMLNATRHNFFGNNNNPMSMGTRVHQMAMYVIYEAPLQMLADTPTRYKQNQECTSFIAGVPTTWDETHPIAGEMGEYVAIARRSGKKWFVAAMNNWSPRTLSIKLDFIDVPATIDAFADGINADREATDYAHTRRPVTPGETINVSLAPGGGWTAVIE